LIKKAEQGGATHALPLKYAPLDAIKYPDTNLLFDIQDEVSA
jgi:hypothetical protein